MPLHASTTPAPVGLLHGLQPMVSFLPSRPPSTVADMGGGLADADGVAMLMSFQQSDGAPRPATDRCPSPGVLANIAGGFDSAAAPGGSNGGESTLQRPPPPAVLAPTPVAAHHHHSLSTALYRGLVPPRPHDLLSISPPLRPPTPLELAVMQADAELCQPASSQLRAPSPATLAGWGGGGGASGAALSACTSSGRGPDLFGLPTDHERATAAGWGVAAAAEPDAAGLAFGDGLLADEKI